MTRHVGAPPLLDADFDRAAVTAIAVAHGGHLSWNARRVRSDGRQERFVTQRCHRVGARAAGRCLDALLADLNSGGWDSVSVEREYDSAPAIDTGWIKAAAGRG